ncbi:MAG: metallophosphoesterase [Planctomycetia bacterium]|nr:metallophosphoesterase [Planctomycetia bacterium]
MMLRCLMLAAVLLSLAPFASAAEPVTVRGRVILDLNANGQLDANEKGLTGVAVTDGMQFVLTGDDGTFELKTIDDPVIPYKPAQVINLCWSSGYWPTGLWYRRLADIKPGEQLLFGLRKDEQKLPLAVIQSTDPHNNYTGELSANWRQEVLGLGNVPKFAIITGDLGYASLESADNMFGTIQAYARSFPVPMFLTPGNHDISLIHGKEWKKQHELAASGGYTKYLGPIRWSFDYAGVHFVGLDWVYETPDGKLDGGTPKSAVDWLAKDLERLKPGTRIFAFSHSQWSPQEEFYDVLRKHKVELFLAGHSHQNLDVSSDGLKMLTTVNLLGIDAPYCLLHIYDGGHDAVSRCTGKAKSNHRGDCALRVPPFEALRRDYAACGSFTMHRACRRWRSRLKATRSSVADWSRPRCGRKRTTNGGCTSTWSTAGCKSGPTIACSSSGGWRPINPAEPNCSPTAARRCSRRPTCGAWRTTT